MLHLVHAYTLPAAFSVLPTRLESPEASAMLLAIGLQESRFDARRQRGGPARGFWQFEREGLRGVLTHPVTHAIVARLLTDLRYDPDLEAVFGALEHNDVLAAAIARLLLLTLPSSLPGPDNPAAAWRQYVEAWRPGRPRRDSWDGLYARAWALADPARRREVVA